MEAYKCDRCGKYYDEKSKDSFPYAIRKRRDSGPANIIDLCDKCKKEFMTWIKGSDLVETETSPAVVEKPKSYKDYDKSTKLVDVVNLEKLLTAVYPEDLSHRTRLRNILKDKKMGDIYLDDAPKGIGKAAWKRVKDYILTYIDFNT